MYNSKKGSERSTIQHQQNTAKQDEEQKRLVALEEQYGKRGASLDKESLHVWVYNESRKVVIYTYDYNKREVYSFDEIISCDLNSNDNVSETVIPGQNETTYVTKTNGKSLAGRALVGAAIAGPVGAIIGGATAKKTTIGVTKTTPLVESAVNDMIDGALPRKIALPAAGTAGSAAGIGNESGGGGDIFNFNMAYDAGNDANDLLRDFARGVQRYRMAGAI